MKHPDDQLAAAQDLLADGHSQAEIAAKLAEQFGVSERTGYRIAKAAATDMSDTGEPADTGKVDYLLSAIETMHNAMLAAAQAGDQDKAFERGERLTGALSKARVARWSV